MREHVPTAFSDGKTEGSPKVPQLLSGRVEVQTRGLGPGTQPATSVIYKKATESGFFKGLDNSPNKTHSPPVTAHEKNCLPGYHGGKLRRLKDPVPFHAHALRRTRKARTHYSLETGGLISCHMEAPGLKSTKPLTGVISYESRSPRRAHPRICFFNKGKQG